MRPSGTEPIFRVYVESKNDYKVKQLISKYRKIVEDIIKK